MFHIDYLNMFDDKFFSDLTPFNFTSQLTSNQPEIEPGVSFAEHFELLPVKPNDKQLYMCFLTSDCLGYLGVWSKTNEKFNYRFRCSVCKKTISPIKFTWFEGLHLSIMKNLETLYLWCAQEPCNRFTDYLKCNKNTTTSYTNKIRQFALDVMLSSNDKIGGVGVVVEIDETMIYKRKYNRGRLLSNQKESVWVVGGIERNSKKCFMKIVPNRSKETLSKLIEEKVEKGSVIYTDQWKGYNNLAELGYSHETVNHSVNFLNPDNPDINTQTVERLWKSVKESTPKSAHGDSKSDYIGEFTFRHHYFYNKKIGSRFKIMIKLIARRYRSPMLTYKVTHN